MVRKLAALGFMLFIGALSLSDRAPGVVKGGLRAGQDLFNRIEMRSGHDLLSRADVPLEWDTAGHLLLWFVAGFLGWWAVGRRVGPLFLILALGTVSAGVEVAQVLLSSTRMAQITDLFANLAGITLGVGLAVGLELAARGMRRVRNLLP